MRASGLALLCLVGPARLAAQDTAIVINPESASVARQQPALPRVQRRQHRGQPLRHPGIGVHDHMIRAAPQPPAVSTFFLPGPLVLLRYYGW
jgi:hypothetical protein